MSAVRLARVVSIVGFRLSVLKTSNGLRLSGRAFQRSAPTACSATIRFGDRLVLCNLRFPHRSAEFQIVTVRIGKVNRLCRHPIVVHGSSDNDAALLQSCRGGLDVNFINGESEVFFRPRSPVLLQYDHASFTTCPQEQPFAPFVPEANFKAQSFSIEGFRLREILYPDSYFVKTPNWQHVTPPFSSD